MKLTLQDFQNYNAVVNAYNQANDEDNQLAILENFTGNETVQTRNGKMVAVTDFDVDSIYATVSAVKNYNATVDEDDRIGNSSFARITAIAERAVEKQKEAKDLEEAKAAKLKKYGLISLGAVAVAALGYLAFLNKETLKPMAISLWNTISSYCAAKWSQLSAAASRFAHAHPVMVNRAEGFVAGAAVTGVVTGVVLNRQRIRDGIVSFSNTFGETAKTISNKFSFSNSRKEI